MPRTSAVTKIFLSYLRELEPNAEYTVHLPTIKSSSGKTYFAKVGSRSDKDQFVGEAESLKAINIAAPGLAPQLLASGVTDRNEDDISSGEPYFLSEYRDFTHLTDKAGEILGKRMATELHAHKSKNGFGFEVPTYCGATRQENGWYERWEECYSAMIGNLLSKLKGQGRYADLCQKGDQVRERVIPYLLKSLVRVEPVLLHGDLWSGNTGTDRSNGQPVIFDPSSYYGHNEADLAIARIFGGIPKSFFTTYHSHLPKSEPVDQYELRADLYELYHYLNHTVLFGSSYAGSAHQKMDRLLRECPESRIE
ncbi:hypothetical protein SERLADRAFT_455949 [Serpula lacrymans var. lacrymans S7.9]|uniref:protein-ribulosamine 3-kinase n=1 Tax=Serpula lacrymans var. lacrymans (strain S7.9) TaxID=578457 RepID=F8NF63_SERL9|nr:uncharacterized protein SERLADRAFT_455949 [Serpula lacrymans var. lacrymans S7.9]EGO31182.1 hypothetical protein SERLADRAFT_455949 [Serpula lacrymans var. lacrymans S7.9]